MLYQEAGLNLGKLVDEKQRAYGDAITGVNEILMVMYPGGIKPEQYRDVGLIVRVLDKLLRISRGDKEAFGENPWNDIAGYGLLGMGGKNKVNVQPINRSCQDCKHIDVSASVEPCRTCWNKRNWQPIEEGSE